MAGTRWLVVMLLALLLGGGRVCGDDESGTSAQDGRAKALTAFVSALRMRMEARLEEGRLHSRAGRDDEALAAFRSVHEIYARGLAEIRALLDRFDERTVHLNPPEAPVAPAPLVLEEEVIETPEEQQESALSVGGGVFRSRGGSQVRGPKGGGRSYADGVDDALRWLAAHQSPNGGWEAAGFRRWCDGKPVTDRAKQPEGPGKNLYDVGVTGLALCAFLGAGYTNRGQHPFAKVVSRGLRYLKAVQDREGCFGPKDHQQYIYCHATASLAMVEAYGMTGSAQWKDSAQRALNFCARARNPQDAWRYGIRSGNCDTSVSGWMTVVIRGAALVNAAAIKAGRPAPLQIDEAAFDGMRSWLEKVTDKSNGRVGYITRGSGSARPQALMDRYPGDKTEAMTAVGILTRVFLGEDPRRSAVIKKGVERCLELVPEWIPSKGTTDMYYWYYGTLAMFQVGGYRWDRWEAGLKKAVLETQRKDTDFCQYRGSWDPAGVWGPDGGRVYSTALMAMCLEVSIRYDRVFGTK